MDIDITDFTPLTHKYRSEKAKEQGAFEEADSEVGIWRPDFGEAAGTINSI